MTTPNNNPNIDGTIRIVIEYDDAQSAQFAQSAREPDNFPSAAQDNNNSSGGRFDIGNILQSYMQEQSSYFKEMISAMSTIAVSNGQMTQILNSINANIIKIPKDTVEPATQQQIIPDRDISINFSSDEILNQLEKEEAILQEQSSYFKEMISAMSTIAVSVGVLTQTMQSVNSNTTKTMTQDARRDAESRATMNRRNRESRREQERRDDINAPKVEQQQYKADQQQYKADQEQYRVSQQQYRADQEYEKFLQQMEKTLQAVFGTQRAESSVDLGEAKVVAQLQATERRLIESQEKVARENRLASARTRRDNKTSREKDRRDEEKHEAGLLKMMEQIRKEAAVADKESARAVTAQEYAVDAGQRRQVRELRSQLYIESEDVNRLAIERRRQQEQESARKRGIISTYGEQEGGRMLYYEERDKRKQREEYRKEYDKEHGIGGYQEKTMRQMSETLTNILGLFTFGVAFKNSKVANELLGTISRIMGVLMDVFLTPFLPLLVPLIQGLAKLVPMVQGFIQSFQEDPKGAIIGLIKDIFSPTAWKDLFGNIFPDMSVGDILKVIFGGGAALAIGGALISAPMIMLKLFGAGTGLLTRGLMALFGRVSGRGGGVTGEATSNIMFSRSVGGFAGSVAAFTRAVGVFGVRGGMGMGTGVGGYTGSRFATTSALQRVPGVSPSIPGIGGRTVGFTGATMATTPALQRVPGVTGVPGIGRGTVGFIPSGAITPMVGPQRPFIGPNIPSGSIAPVMGPQRPFIGPMMPSSGVQRGISPIGGVQNTSSNVLGRSGRIMANTSSSMARSATAITRMGGTVARILPAVAGLSGILGPLALAAGAVGLGAWFLSSNRDKIESRNRIIDEMANDPLDPNTNIISARTNVAPTGSTERATLEAIMTELEPWDMLSMMETRKSGEDVRITPENFGDYYGDDWSSMENMAKILAGIGTIASVPQPPEAQLGVMGTTPVTQDYSVNDIFSQIMKQGEMDFLNSPLAREIMQLQATQSGMGDISAMYSMIEGKGLSPTMKLDKETGEYDYSFAGQNLTSKEQGSAGILVALLESWLEKTARQSYGVDLDVRFNASTGEFEPVRAVINSNKDNMDKERNDANAYINASDR